MKIPAEFAQLRAVGVIAFVENDRAGPEALQGFSFPGAERGAGDTDA
jgi:hypothetical protein